MSDPKMKLSEVYGTAKEHDKTQLCRFMRDMKRAGLKQRVYYGRLSWSGPAVVCEDIEAVLANTNVPCLSVKKGRRFVVYPRQGL